MTLGLVRRCAGLALVPLLGGCIAMALPVLAGGAMFAGGNVRIRAATPVPAYTAARAPSGSVAFEAMPGSAKTGPVLTSLTALPPPDGAAAASDPWQRFFAYALDHAEAPRKGQARSALLVERPSLDLPRQRACGGHVPAVIVDLDSAGGASGPARAARPGLAEGLARLRGAGVVVVWISAQPAAAVSEIAATLRGSGLDPAGADPLLLVRSPGDRKQALREEANRDVCVIALAGDRRGDFDELFDYLRDPNGAAGLDSLLGAGWFFVPPPLG